MQRCREPLKLSLFFLIALSLSGCLSLGGTFYRNHMATCNRVYIGTRLDLRLITEMKPIWFLGFLDLPFSLVVDTLLLPYTIRISIRDCSLDDHDEKKDEQTGKGEKKSLEPSEK